MNPIEYSKRQAKRLLKLAQNLTPDNQAVSLPIQNLSQAREHIAFLQGYNNWYDYETFIKKNEKKKTLNHHYFLGELEELKALIDSSKDFLIHPDNSNDKFKEQAIQSLPIDLKLGTSFVQSKNPFSKKDTLRHIKDYPLVLWGANSSGKISCAFNLIHQWLENKQGCIIFEHNHNNDTHQKIDDIMQKNKHPKSLQILNFIREEDNISLVSDSIDPINPLIGHLVSFKLMFGQQLGLLIHEIAKVAQRKKMLLDYSNIEAMLSLVNLQYWIDNHTWEEASPFIEQYLLENPQEKHIENCLQAFRYLKILKSYTQTGVFSITPSVNIKDVLRNQSVLHCVFSTTYKYPFFTPNEYDIYSHQPFKELDYPRIGDIMALHVMNACEQLDEETPDIRHNIAMTDFECTFSHHINDYFFEHIEPDHHWIFAGYIPQHEYPTYQTIEEQNKLGLVEIAKTIVLMQSNTYSSDLPDTLKLRLMKNVIDMPNIFHDKNQDLYNQPFGEGYVMMKIEGVYQFNKITLFYDKK